MGFIAKSQNQPKFMRGRIGDGVEPSEGANVVSDKTILQMMEQSLGPSEIIPYGNTADYVYAGRPGPYSHNPTGHDPDYTHANGWLQIAPAIDYPVPSPDVLFQVSKLQLWILLDTGEWIKCFSDNRLRGGLYDDDFDIGTREIASEFTADLNSTIIQLKQDKWIHYYPRSARFDFTALGTILGFVSVVDARMVSASGADISNQVGKYCISMGADYWISATASDNGANNNNSDIFISSFIELGVDRRKFYGTNLSEAQLRLHRPPRELEQYVDGEIAVGLLPEVIGNLGVVSGAYAGGPSKGLPNGWDMQGGTTLLGWEVIDVGVDDGNGREYFTLRLTVGDSTHRTMVLLIRDYYYITAYKDDEVICSVYPTALSGVPGGFFLNLNKDDAATQAGPDLQPVDGSLKEQLFVLTTDSNVHTAIIATFGTNQVVDLRLARPVATYVDLTNIFIPGSIVDVSTLPSTAIESPPGTLTFTINSGQTARAQFGKTGLTPGDTYKFRFRRLSGVCFYRIGSAAGLNDVKADTFVNTSAGFWEADVVVPASGALWLRWFNNNPVVIGEISVRKLTP